MKNKQKPDPRRLDRLRHHVDKARAAINQALDELADEADWAAADELLHNENYRVGNENEKLTKRVRELEAENDALLQRLGAVCEIVNK